MNYAVAVCPEKTRNIPFLTSFREGENVMLHYFYSIKNLNKNIFKNWKIIFLYLHIYKSNNGNSTFSKNKINIVFIQTYI